MSDMITRSIIVKAEVDKVYHVWSNFEYFPRFMKYIRSIQMVGERKSHWVMKGPLGKGVEWDAYTTRMDKNQRVAWSSKDGEKNDVTTSGQAVFSPLPNGETEVTVMMQYIPKAGLPGEVVAKLFSHPDERMEEDLRNFKYYIEGMPERMTTTE
ncbi:MAG TPA: SRPBCC family protein [Anaerolineales bacterium]